MINIPIIEDSLAIRAVAYRFDNSGTYNNVAASTSETAGSVTTFSAVAVDRDDVGNNIIEGGRLSARWQPSEKLTVNASYLSQTIEQDGWGQADIDLGAERSQRRLQVQVSEDPLDQDFRNEGYDDEVDIFNLTIEYDLAWGSLLSSTSWVDEETTVIRDLSAFFSTYILSLEPVYSK